ncbi:hypothetical protein [Devosia sp. SL43]|uniref:hypothetical protein n=1 Tax=Devosia sp. SL43 TaxID=2806348 RepID=UPI001F3892F4|nr:hypothetical protein [Devosia sp. SL43]UJW84641.1 hypothetical protein IM737_14575 [Devosia sp. SL43]
MKHKYKVGQSLELLPNRGASSRKAGTCNVVALLPFEGHALQYRIQATTETHQRIVSEGDLTAPRDEAPALFSA